MGDFPKSSHILTNQINFRHIYEGFKETTGKYTVQEQ